MLNGKPVVARSIMLQGDVVVLGYLVKKVE